MSTTTPHEAQISADPDVPTITITREFDAAPDRVFPFWTDRDLFVQWIGPDSTTARIDTWDCRTGGSYRYADLVGGEEVASFYGSFHEVRPGERIVQTFTWEGAPDGVALETITFEEIPEGRTRITTLSVVESMETQRMILSSGMEVGVNEGYAKLDRLLAAGS
ncbi:MAG TPA: SRPBCC family protein [Nocardioidaceae bacterium]|nr:SRPBCC family protein [Nocardioidaceae bacterium]